MLRHEIIIVSVSLAFALILTLSLYFPLLDKRKKLQNEEFVNKFHERNYMASFPQTKRQEFDLYYHGINDIYDAVGNKIQGLEPNPLQAINTLQVMIDEDNDPHDRIQLARIYEQGMHNFEPNIQQAEQAYIEILNNVPDPDIRNEAREGLGRIGNGFLGVGGYFIGADEDDLFNVDINRAIINHYTREADTVGTRFRNDSQNTHDSGVVSTVKNSVKKLDQSTNMTRDLDQTKAEMLQYINSQPDSEKRKDALESFNDILNNKTTVQTGKTLPATLNLVWNRIHDPKNSENTQVLKENMFNHLAEMREHGKTVCSTGVSNKLIDVLNVVDPEVAIKPMHAINEEMMTKSAHVRNEFVKNVDNRELYEQGTHPQQDELDQNLKTNIIQELNKDYVDSGIMSKSKLKNELEKWIDHI